MRACERRGTLIARAVVDQHGRSCSYAVIVSRSAYGLGHCYRIPVRSLDEVIDALDELAENELGDREDA